MGNSCYVVSVALKPSLARSLWVFWGLVIVLLQTSCYTLSQGIQQAGLFLKRRPIADVIRDRAETPERLQKLAVVADVMRYVKERVGLTPGSSYTSYVALEGKSLVYVVKAASPRALEVKTWWFPFVGAQPYLGFFRRDDAVTFQKKLIQQGYDTALGGVQAFSLLGYFPDPVYSSMLDGESLPEIVETLIHETVHRTLYIPNQFSFNENLADFVARKAMMGFFESSPQWNVDLLLYKKNHEKNESAQNLFRSFLIKAKQDLDDFYKKIDAKMPDSEFFPLKKEKFKKLSQDYLAHMNGLQYGTRYENAFQAEKTNNAVLLAYAVYESKQQPLEDLLERCHRLLPEFMEAIKSCSKNAKNEDELWKKLETCKN